MRLTEKDITYITSGANVIEIPDIIEGHKYTGQAVIKLGHLEDIEEELGIDLILLFKAINSPIYTKSGTQYYVGFDLIEQDSKGDWYFSTVDGNYYFKDYGKTWALTKENSL